MFTHFQNDSLRNLVIAFGSLFNNIFVKRYLSNGTVKESLRVPLAYGNKEKYLRRIDEGGSITNEDGVVVQMTLPRMSFEIENFEYDTSRKRNTMQKLAKRNADDNNKMDTTYAEVPYLVNFNLYIMTKHMADGLQIIEQILPYFTPEFTVTINPTSMHNKMDIPLVLNSVDSEEDWEGDYDTRRSLTWTLTFTAKSYVYGKISTSERIKRVMATLFDGGVPAGTTAAAASMIDIGVTGPSGGSADTDASNYTPTTTFRTWGSNTGDIDIYGDIIGG